MHDTGGCRYGIMNINLSESFNKVLKGARSLLITALIRLSFECLSKWFSVRSAITARRRKADRIFTDKIRRKLNARQLKSREHYVIKYNNQPGLYEIQLRRRHYSLDEPDYTQTIDLGARTCTCRKWQLLHYPCSHLFAVCAS